MMTTRRSAGGALMAAAALAALALGGCGGGNHSALPAPSPSTSSDATSTTTMTTGTTTPPTTAAPTTTTTPSATPVASKSVTDATDSGPTRVSWQIFDLHRQGPFVRLDLSTDCREQGACDVILGATRSSGPGDNGEDAQDINGMMLIDPVHDRIYYEVLDADGNAYDSLDYQGNVNTVDLAWARFPAPPSTVTKLDVASATGPVFAAVPLTSGPPPKPAKGWVVETPSQFSQSPSSSNTKGLTMPTVPLTLTVGNRNGSNRQAGDSTQITLSSDVLFAFDKANLTAKAHAIISAAAAQIKGRAEGTVSITGYTDSIGSDAVNIPLSIHRAEAVAAALEPLTPGVHYVTAGKGSADPVAPNTLPNGADNPAGRALNRRVTITFKTKSPAPPKPPIASNGAGVVKPTRGTTMSFPAGSDLKKPDGHWRAADATLTRDGNLMRLQMTVTCTAPSGGCDDDDLAGTDDVPPQSNANQADVPPYTLSGFYLEDPSNGDMYSPVHDAYGNPLTSYVNPDRSDLNSPQKVWIYFPAPPAGVTSIDLVAPQGAAALRVPVSR